MVLRREPCSGESLAKYLALLESMRSPVIDCDTVWGGYFPRKDR